MEFSNVLILKMNWIQTGVVVNIIIITMYTSIPIVKAFIDAGKEYKNVEFEKYKKMYAEMNIEEKEFKNVEELNLHLNNITCYMLCNFNLIDNQKYVLCHHLLFISKSLKNMSLEMRECFYNKLFFYTDCFIYNNNTDAELIKWLYRIYLQMLEKEKDLNLYTLILQLCTNFFVEENETLVIDFVLYTMQTDIVINSMIKQYNTNRQHILWSDTEYEIANFLYHVSLNYIKYLPYFECSYKWKIEFSKRQLGIVFLLLSSEDEEVWFLTMYYLSVISYMLQDYTTCCSELFTTYNVDKITSYLNNITTVSIKESISYLFLQSLNNIIINNSNIVDYQMMKNIMTFYSSLNYTTRKDMIHEMLHFLTITFTTCTTLSEIEKDFVNRVVNFVKHIYINHKSEHITNVLLDSIITLIQGGFIGNDRDFFKIIYNDGPSYVYNQDSCYRYSMIIYNWLILSYKNNWKFNEIVLNNLDVVDTCIKPINAAMYIKNVLVSISLFDKCKLAIQNNYTKFTHDELDLFNFFIHNK